MAHEARSAIGSAAEGIGADDAPTEGFGEAHDLSDELARTDEAVRSEVGY